MHVKTEDSERKEDRFYWGKVWRLQSQESENSAKRLYKAAENNCVDNKHAMPANTEKTETSGCGRTACLSKMARHM